MAQSWRLDEFCNPTLPTFLDNYPCCNSENYGESYKATFQCVDKNNNPMDSKFCEGLDFPHPEVFSCNTQPRECYLDADCPNGNNCINYECRNENQPNPECKNNNDCAENYFCNDDGDCEVNPQPEPECENHNDCAENYFCNDDGDCQVNPQPEPEPECEDHNDCAENYFCNDNGDCEQNSQPEPKPGNEFWDWVKTWNAEDYQVWKDLIHYGPVSYMYGTDLINAPNFGNCFTYALNKETKDPNIAKIPNIQKISICMVQPRVNATPELLDKSVDYVRIMWTYKFACEQFSSPKNWNVIVSLNNTTGANVIINSMSGVYESKIVGVYHYFVYVALNLTKDFWKYRSGFTYVISNGQDIPQQDTFYWGGFGLHTNPVSMHGEDLSNTRPGIPILAFGDQGTGIPDFVKNGNEQIRIINRNSQTSKNLNWDYTPGANIVVIQMIMDLLLRDTAGDPIAQSDGIPFIYNLLFGVEVADIVYGDDTNRWNWFSLMMEPISRKLSLHYSIGNHDLAEHKDAKTPYCGLQVHAFFPQSYRIANAQLVKTGANNAYFQGLANPIGLSFKTASITNNRNCIGNQTGQACNPRSDCLVMLDSFFDGNNEYQIERSFVNYITFLLDVGDVNEGQPSGRLFHLLKPSDSGFGNWNQNDTDISASDGSVTHSDAWTMYLHHNRSNNLNIKSSHQFTIVGHHHENLQQDTGNVGFPNTLTTGGGGYCGIGNGSCNTSQRGYVLAYLMPPQENNPSQLWWETAMMYQRWNLNNNTSEANTSYIEPFYTYKNQGLIPIAYNDGSGYYEKLNQQKINNSKYWTDMSNQHFEMKQKNNFITIEKLDPKSKAGKKAQKSMKSKKKKMAKNNEEQHCMRKLVCEYSSESPSPGITYFEAGGKGANDILSHPTTTNKFYNREKQRCEPAKMAYSENKGSAKCVVKLAKKFGINNSWADLPNIQ